MCCHGFVAIKIRGLFVQETEMNEVNKSSRNEQPRDFNHRDFNHRDLKFYYSREDRIRKRHKPHSDRRSGFMSRKKRRGLIIIIIDVILIAIVFFYITKPTNVLLTKEQNSLVYELNITGVRGGKILIGFTIRNEGSMENAVGSHPVNLRITDKAGHAQSYQEYVERGTILEPGESSSTVFLISRDELPASGLTELFYGTESKPLFSKNVRY